LRTLKVGDFIEETADFWESCTRRLVTHKDARQIVENVSGFFSVLREWDAAKEIAQFGIGEEGKAGQIEPGPIFPDSPMVVRVKVSSANNP